MEKQVNNVCEYLKTYYDTNILSLDKNEEIKDIFMKAIKKAQIISTSNITLLKLLRNIDIPKQIEPKLYGPFTCSLHTSRDYRMNIYIFGEYHSNVDEDAKYTNIISEYLYNTMNTSTVFIDFFLEYHKFRGKYNYENLYIDRLRKKFQPCIRKHSSCMILDTSRSHYLDIRDLENMYDPLIIYKYMYEDYLNGQEYGKNIKNFNALMDLTYIDNNNVVEYVKTRMPELKRLDKELNKTDKNIKKLLMAFQIYKFSKIKKFTPITKDEVSKVFKTKQKDRDTTDIIKKINHIYNRVLIPIGGILTDIYVLARLFKKFKVRDGDNQPDRVYNAVMYAGNNHSDNYRIFLERLKFREVFNINQKKGTMLNLPIYRQPLFSVNSGVINKFDKNEYLKV